MNRYILTIILASVVGIFGGISGQAGDLQLLTGLLLLGIVKTQRMAAGTLLLFNAFPFMLLSAYKYYKKGDIDIKITLLLIIVSLFSSRLGAELNYKIKPRNVNYIIGFVTLFSGIYFIYRGIINKK